MMSIYYLKGLIFQDILEKNSICFQNLNFSWSVTEGWREEEKQRQRSGRGEAVSSAENCLTSFSSCVVWLMKYSMMG